jgi:multiple sugar transport system ATP-binding protein
MIQVKNLNLAFTKEYFALFNINLQIKGGEHACIVGDGESGKTTLLRVVAGLEEFEKGEVNLKGINVKKINFEKDVSLGYISFNGVFFDKKSVYDNLLYVLKIRKIDEVNAGIKINQALREYNIEALKNLKIKQLSGYQKVLVQLARLSLRNIEIYLMDDIFKKLSSREIEIISNHIKNLQKEDSTFLIATANKEVADTLGDRIINLKLGSIEDKKE